MIYLSDDYISKYSDTLSYLIARSYKEGYSLDYIEKVISHSLMINELEKSNITIIAFSSMEKIYSEIFTMNDNNFELNIYDEFGWVGNIYMHLFLSLKITFESLFLIVPIKEMLDLYNLYHEMSFSQILEYVKEKNKYSILDIVMKRRDISNSKLSAITGISISTIGALRYSKRDISKLEAHKLLLLANALNVKMETLLPDIGLMFL
jgi:DNA-binding Xre family transcriptional regulator